MSDFPWTGSILPWSAALRLYPYKDPSAPHKGTLADLPRATKVTVLKQERGWLRVETTLGGKKLAGYVSHELVGREKQVPLGNGETGSKTSKPTASAGRGDELTPIAVYMIGEMKTNAASSNAKSIRDYNINAAQDCLAEYKKMPLLVKLFGGAYYLESCQQGAASFKLLALTKWATLVRENGVWDHKKYIRENFKPADPKAKEQHWHHYNGYVYFYDTWSNIHYGYVGKACGFTDSELLDGAGLEQIGSDIVHLRMPKGSPGVEGLRKYDSPADRESVELGIELYPRVPTAMELVKMIEKAPHLLKKPL